MPSALVVTGEREWLLGSRRRQPPLPLGDPVGEYLLLTGDAGAGAGAGESCLALELGLCSRGTRITLVASGLWKVFASSRLQPEIAETRR